MRGYFPVEEKPLTMGASLLRFGADLGMGELDRCFFQADAQLEAWRAKKRRAPAGRRFVVGDDARAREARAEALAWMRATLAREQPETLARIDADADADDPFDAIGRNVQEDFAVLEAGPDDRGRTLVVDVRFPSGWRPERLREASFDAIHGPVPGFPAGERAAQGMVRAMVDKGPYVRFVWTVSPDPSLDQHPDRAAELKTWDAPGEPFFRVERQVTVPLRETRSTVFLIRVYMTPVRQLDPAQQRRLVEALRRMPADVRAYKRLPTADRFAQRIADVE